MLEHVDVVVVVRRRGATVLHEPPVAPRLPVALTPDDVLDVVVTDVLLHVRGDGVALGLAGDHEVDGLPGAVLTPVGAVPTDVRQSEAGLHGGAEALRVGDETDARALGRDSARVAAGRSRRGRRGGARRAGLLLGRARGHRGRLRLRLRLRLGDGLDPRDTDGVGLRGRDLGGRRDRGGHRPRGGAGGTVLGRAVEHRDGAGQGQGCRGGGGRLGAACIEGDGEGDGGTADDAETGGGLGREGGGTAAAQAVGQAPDTARGSTTAGGTMT